jgi:hypothetical protein
MMDLQKTYSEIDNIHADYRMEARIAASLARKIEPLMPAGWDVSYVIGMWHGLCLSRHTSIEAGEGSPLAEFKLVCRLVELATGMKVPKSPWIDGDRLFGIFGTLDYPLARGYNLRISVRLFETKECKLIVRDKLIREAELADDCLGEKEAL